MPEAQTSVTRSERKTPWNFLAILRVSVEAVVGNAGNFPIEGGENLEKIDWSRPTLVAVDHTSDVNVQAAIGGLARVKPDIDIAVANQTTQHDPRAGLNWEALKLAGLDRFVPIGWTWGPDGKPKPYLGRKGSGEGAGLDLGQFEVAAKQFDVGRTLVVAAHNPTFDGKLAKRAGIAVAAIAHMREGVQIIPVGIAMQGDAPNSHDVMGAIRTRSKRNIAMKIGEPFELGKGEVSIKELREAGGVVMNHIAVLLPENQRNGWGTIGEVDKN